MKNTKMRTAALVIVLFLAAGLAVWLFLSPAVERGEAQKQQDALLASIEQGDGVIVVDSGAAVDMAPVDYYDAPDGGEDVIRLFWTPPEGAETPTPAPQAADTGAITGIGVLTIDAIDLEMPVVNGVSEAQLKIAAGWVPQTAPIGETGNAVIAGHRNYTHGSHFNRLGELAVGDVIRYRSVGGEEMSFTVHEVLEVLPGDQSAFEQPDDMQMLTLYTCTPIRTATHRLLVRASRTA